MLRPIQLYGNGLSLTFIRNGVERSNFRSGTEFVIGHVAGCARYRWQRTARISTEDRLVPSSIILAATSKKPSTQMISKRKDLKMTRKLRTLVVLAIMIIVCRAVEAGPPLPLHTIEGNSGVCITSTAYLANPAEEGEVFGLPSISTTGVFLGEKDLQSFAVTQNIWGPVEFGYAFERFGLGDWPDDVMTAAGARVDHHLGMHNVNGRVMIVKEGDFDCSSMPAITFGTHLKWSQGQTKLDEDLGGLLGTLGSDHSRGIEFTLVATKTVTDLLPRPVILSAGVRNGDAIHTGLFGFAGERKTTFECSAIAFLSDKLAFAAEYRQKSDMLDQFSAGGYHLVKAENDWWTLCLGYVVNDNMTVSGGYANLGNVANHREENAFGIQVKYEF